MAVKTAYKSKVGADYKISENFKLKEMACKDGTDKVLYSTGLMAKLEELRAYGGFKVHINSGYRTAAYNKKIGGATASQHINGRAADIVVYKDGSIVNARKICCLCQSLGFKGIGYISEAAVHVDMRPSGSYRGDERRGYGGNVNGNFYRYFNISEKQINAMKVPQEAESEEDMTQEQFNRMMDNYLEAKAKEEPSDWSREAREWSEAESIIFGDDNGEKQYKAFCSREQVVTFLYRLAKKGKGE